MDWLDPPYQFFHPEPGLPFILPVVRYEVGLAQRPVDDPSGYVVRTTIRFHVPGPVGWGLRPYVDFTNQGLIQRVLSLYEDMLDRTKRTLTLDSISTLEALSPARPRPLMLRLTRHGRRLDTMYEAEVLEE